MVTYISLYMYVYFLKVLANAQGFIAIPFVVNIGTSAPPSVRLIPCRPYSGAPIGTTYEVQLFTGITKILLRAYLPQWMYFYKFRY